MKQLQSTQELLAELATLRTRLAEAEDTLAAIRQGRVDAVVVDGPQGGQIFTLLEADQPYRVMIESMQEGAVTLTTDGTILFSNQSFARLVRTPLEQILGRNLRQFIAAADHTQFAVLLEHGHAVSSAGELPLLTSDSTQVPVALSLTSLRTYDLPAVCMVVTDLTDQKRHAELAAAQQALRESEARFRALADTAPGMVWTARPDGTIYYANRQWFMFCGLTQEENTQAWPQLVLHPDDRERCLAQWTRALRDGTDYESEARNRRHDGEYRWLLTRAVPVRDAQGRIMAWYGTTTDIHGRKQNEEEREHLLAELQRINAELQQFSYAVSHDLNEPLRTISNFLQLFMRRSQEKLDVADKEYLTFAVDGAQRMRQMLADLLAYTRVDGPTGTFTVVDSEALLTRVLSELQVAIADAKADVTHDPLPTVLGDATRLGQVLQNLIGNALKFRGVAALRIHVSAQRDSQHWRFAVRDNGIGIDPQQTGRLFKVFQRLHTHSEYPGTGIGLAICKKIVERHGGRIWVESQPGEGSIFYFTVKDAC